MREFKITKHKRVELTEPFDGIVAVQLVTYEIDFHGTIISGTKDTKIMEDGRQFVIDGDGWLKQGYEIK